MTKERVASMTEGRFDHAVILHEAGIPPIHTPMSVFKDLSEDVISSYLQLIYATLFV